MTSQQRGLWWRRPLAVLAALAMTGGAVVVSAPAASAAPATPEVSAGSLDWGVKESFRNYLKMSFAGGTTTLGGGASENADGTYNFPAAAVDPAAQLVSFGGSVSYSAHEGQLAVEISDIRLDLARGFLVADVVSKSRVGTAMVTYDDVDLTTLGAGASVADGEASGTALPAKLTAGGVPAFASFYGEGDPFDPVSFAVSYVAPVEVPVVTASPAAQAVESGAPVTFTAAATGHDALQWQVLAAGSADWADIAGASSPTLTITASALENGNQYRAAFTNAGGVVYSGAAALTVTEAEEPVPVFTPELKVFAADGVTVLSGPVAEGTKVVVKGSGFDPQANIAPAGSRPPIAAGNPAGVYVVFGKFADKWRPSEGAPSSARVVGDQLWALSQAALDAVPAAYKKVVSDQWVEISPEGNFTATLTVAKKTDKNGEVQWPEAGNFGAYTYPAGGTSKAAQELYAPITVGKPVPVFTPELKVFAADGVTVLSGPVAEGTKVVVKGSGFDPQANIAPAGSRPPIAAGNPAGVYVVFGKFADKWRPSEGAPSSARVVGDQLWALSQVALDAVPAAYKKVVSDQWVEISPEGNFTATLTVAKKTDKNGEVQWPEAGNFGAYTYPAGGTSNAAQELYAPITVGKPAEPVAKPALKVEPATGLKHASKVMVSGSGYTKDRWIYIAETAQGPGADRVPESYENAVRLKVDPDGTFGPVEFSVTTVFKNGGFNAIDNTLYISTFSSPLDIDNIEHNYSADRSQDEFVKLAWADASAPNVPEPEVPANEPTLTLDAASVEAGKTVKLTGADFAPGSTLAFDLNGEEIAPGAPSAAVGGLEWGVKESFRNYLGSSIAQGTIVTDGGATDNPDGTYHFPAVSFDAANKIASFAGSVSMVGHDGALQVTLSNLRVDVKAASLLADATSKSLDGELNKYSDVALVSIDTTAVTGGNEGVSGKNLATVLTKAGVPAFADFYPVGTSFDGLSFEVRSLAPAEQLLVDANGAFSLEWTVPARQKSGKYTVTATATAPEVATLAHGVVQTGGVQKASAALEITAAAITPPTTDKPTAPPVTDKPTQAPEGSLNADAKCSNGKVVGGTLTWGVKESFRKYITGNIAKGQITFNGSPATWDQLFTFTKGAGSIDAGKRTGEVVFDGVVRFQGHDYGSGPVLSVTMQKLTLVMDGNVGTLQADVVSRSLESATVGAKPGANTTYNSVVLATLDLSGAALNTAETMYSGTAVQTTLAASGVAPFADFYAAGESLDALSFNLGCSEGAVLPENNAGALAGTGTGTGTGAGALAKTGAMGMDASVIGALLVLMFGSGVIVSNRLVRRRRY
ncbi:HtaA domain-containing protein [Arthrobacter psychrochitiniphilus]|uniref:HtaA domain-containing protein n=1 Tax=Arthrobacter psychrochitiniphilus TaxID=291045 RepID=UPI0035E5D170